MRPFSISSLLLFASALAFARQLPPRENQRLIDTGKLWITVKYFHPYLAYRNDIDWDKALVNALPKIRAAANPEDYATAVNTMLAALHDPLTHAAVLPPGANPFLQDEKLRDEEGKVRSQRSRIHHGLPPHESHSRFYYSGLMIKPSSGFIETAMVPLGANIFARVRLSEPVLQNDGFNPLPQPDRPYTEPPYPSVEYRILAAYQVWGVIHYFFAYKDLMDEDWDKTFADYLPKFIAAKDAREYHLTVAEMISYLSDSQATVQSLELQKYFGESFAGLRLRLIEKKPVITEVLDEEGKKAGVKAGDIVTKVDGENIGERIKREANYISASTAQRLGYSVMQRILNGPESSTAMLTIADADGRAREVSLKRSISYLTALNSQRTGDMIKVLPNNIGYADLTRLERTDVDGMFDKLRNTQAIIFDMRGYPHETAGAIASRLAEKQNVQAAIITGPITMQPDLPKDGTETSTASYFEIQTIPNSDQWKYKGKTIMLIDERTFSQAEHTGLFLEAANKTEFIGTPSAGADGGPSNFVIPGGIAIAFSGQDIRHANGGPLQRLGLQPTVTITPTIKGIRAGRDEVLEGALNYLSK
ncbi:MAG: S41 family peptidase [Bryobacteraceae bacterium]